MDYRKDFAPGEPHVALRKKGISYYVPSLFHMALTYQNTVPLFIADVLLSIDPLKVYGQHALELRKECCFLIKNHPFRMFTIMGRVMLVESHDFPARNGTPGYQFYILYIDDYLGEKLTLRVKVEPRLIPIGLLGQNNVLLKVTGTLGEFSGKRQMTATEIMIRGSHNDIECELAWWTAVLNSRTYIEQPWHYIPTKAIAAESTGPPITFEFKDAKKRKDKRKALNRHGNESGLRSALDTGNFDGATDSLFLYNHRNSMPRRSQIDTNLRTKSEKTVSDSTYTFISRAN